MNKLKLNRLLVLIVGLLTMCVTQVWGATSTYTFSSKAWASSVNTGGTACTWTGSKDGNQYTSSGTPKGVQILASLNGLTVTSSASFSNVTSVVVTYSSSSKGVGSIGVKIGSNTALTAQNIAKSQTDKTLTFTPATAQSGQIVITCNCTANSYGIQSIAVTTAAADVKYTVTFNAGSNGTCSTSSLTETSAGAGVTLPSVTANTGFVFKGWATTSDATTANAGAAGANYKPSANCTLYAVYGGLYTVTLGDNSATLTQTTEGANVTLPSRTGNATWTFAGWSTTNNTTETTTAPTIIKAGDYAPTANITLYPVYTRAGSGVSGYYLYETVSGTKRYLKTDCSETTDKSEAGIFNWSNGQLTYTSGGNTYYISHHTSGSTNLVNNTTATSGNDLWTITENSTNKTVKFRSKVQTTRYLGTTGTGFKAYANEHTLTYESASTTYYISVLPASTYTASVVSPAPNNGSIKWSQKNR